MKNLEWTTEDKTSWPNGPWKFEPDKKQWTDEETGYPCLIHRNPGGALCGYVGVAPSHPTYGKSYDEVDARVHGGLTYAARCQPNATPEHGICHTVEVNEEDNIWWHGFDCAHGGDIMPKTSFLLDLKLDAGDEYRDIAYVTNACKSLARQLKAME